MPMGYYSETAKQKNWETEKTTVIEIPTNLDCSKDFYSRNWKVKMTDSDWRSNLVTVNCWVKDSLKNLDLMMGSVIQKRTDYSKVIAKLNYSVTGSMKVRN